MLMIIRLTKTQCALTITTPTKDTSQELLNTTSGIELSKLSSLFKSFGYPIRIIIHYMGFQHSYQLNKTDTEVTLFTFTQICLMSTDT